MGQTRRERDNVPGALARGARRGYRLGDDDDRLGAFQAEKRRHLPECANRTTRNRWYISVFTKSDVPRHDHHADGSRDHDRFMAFFRLRRRLFFSY